MCGATRPGGSSATISKYDYSNDALGLRTGATVTSDVFTATTPWSYGYNARQELTSAVRDANTPAVREWSYGYDPIGNRVSAARNPSSEEYDEFTLGYVANNLNQYDRVNLSAGAAPGAQRLLYDADGNLTTEFAAGDMNCDGDVDFADTGILVAKIGCPNITDCNVPCTWTHGDINGDGVLSWDDIDPYIAQLNTAGRKFEWDAENRLIRVGPLHATPAAGDVKVEFAYDYLGRRIERRKYTWQTANPPAGWALTQATRYVWLDWLLLMEL